MSREEAMNALIESGMELRRDDIELGKRLERERIIENINERIGDLRACNKRDNCHELAELIESYIPEWTDTDYLGKMIRHTQFAYTEGEQK